MASRDGSARHVVGLTIDENVTLCGGLSLEFTGRSPGMAVAFWWGMMATRKDKAMRRLRFGRFGLQEDPRWAHVVFDIGERHYIVQVTEVYRAEERGMTMLRTRHLNGEVGPDVAASFVHVLER